MPLRYHPESRRGVWKRVDLDAVRSPPQILSPDNDLCLPVVMIYRIAEGMCRRECDEAQAIGEAARFAVESTEALVEDGMAPEDARCRMFAVVSLIVECWQERDSGEGTRGGWVFPKH